MGGEAKRILIIEDQKPLADVLKVALTDEHCHVLYEASGRAGLETALSEHPDIILLDIALPEMDGLSALRELRKDEWGKDVPVIVLTNLSDAEHIDEAMKSGVYDFLIKTDWQLDDVVKKVKERLGI